MRSTNLFSLLLILSTLWSCHVDETQENEASTDSIPPTETPVEEEPSAPTPTGITLKKELAYDKHTLEDSYAYGDTTRSFKWEKIKEQLLLIERMQQQSGRRVVFRNYQNKNGEAPTVKNYVRDKYGKVTDHNGVTRYQAAPLYDPNDSTTVIAYARDGWMGHLQDSIGGYYRVRPIVGDESYYLTPKRYVEILPEEPLFTHVAVVDRADQNICTLEKGENGVWIIRSMNPATTGLEKPPYKQATPLGIYLLQEKKGKMFYYRDGTTEIAGYAPWANRFCAGAYIHGIPLNGSRAAPIEYSRSLGTTPRSHMCVRNATSHAKYIYDTFPTMKSLVVVIE